MQAPRLIWTYARMRTRRFSSRDELEEHQSLRLERFSHKVLKKSPWFAQYAHLHHDAWPLMDKGTMVAHFDAMNTAGLRFDDVMACALRAEQSRDFSPTLRGFSIGLSSGTSGSRGVFVASPAERATWAGALLAKLLPNAVTQRERVALFLRANNQLYTTVGSRWLSFDFFDLFKPFDLLIAQLSAFRPTIIVAPAQVLREIAIAIQEGRLPRPPTRVISVAEVLDPLDRALLAEVFGRVDEVYQATEGFLGATCAHGTLHLNEEFVHVERHWLDEKRFVPVITDFTRSTQPIVRYRLDDILSVRGSPCSCGNPALAIDQIEGRCDDTLVLPGRDGASRRVFADVCARALAQSLPLHADYRLTQTAPLALSLAVDGCHAVGALAVCQHHLVDVFARLGVATEALAWTLSPVVPASDLTQKRRRIVRAREAR